MPTTSYTDPGVGWAAWALQARTNSSGTPLDDAGGEDARLVLEMFTPGVRQADDFQVLQNSPAGMSVLVGSGTAKNDLAIIQGADAGQGKYAVRLGTGTTTVTIAAADASNPRIDEIYLVVQDNTYDSSGNVVPRIGYRRGDAAASPSVPGPDAAWDAYLLIATVAVAASATSIVNANITDERVTAGPSSGRFLVDPSTGHTTIEMPVSGQLQILGDDGSIQLAIASGTIDFQGKNFIDLGMLPIPIEFRQSTTVTNSSVTSTLTNKVSLQYAKPAGWNTYEVMVWGLAILESIGGVPVTWRAVIDGNNSTTLSEGAFPDEPVTLSVNHRVTGLTATPITCAIQVAVTGGATFHRGSIQIMAMRTS